MTLPGATTAHPRVVVVRSLLTAFGGAEHAAALNAAGLAARGYRVTFLARPPIVAGHPYLETLRNARVRLATPPLLDRSSVLRAAWALASPAMLGPYLLARPRPPAEAWRNLAEVGRTVMHRLDQQAVLSVVRRHRLQGRELLVHVYGQDGLTPLLATWCRAHSVPLIYTESGEADPAYIERFHLRPTIAVINQIPVVVCCGPLVAGQIRQSYGYRGVIREIPFLVPDPPERPPSRDPAIRGVVLGIVGRLVPHKGHADVIDALAVLRRDGLEASLEIAGTGPIEADLKARALALGITRHVTFHGRFRDVDEVLRNVDVFVLFSTSEGQPLAITEAMARGKAVLASRFGGIPDMIDDGRTGVLVEPDDRVSLLAALRRLVQDEPFRRQMAAGARAHYHLHRRFDAVMDRIEDAYGAARAALSSRPAQA